MVLLEPVYRKSAAFRWGVDHAHPPFLAKEYEPFSYGSYRHRPARVGVWGARSVSFVKRTNTCVPHSPVRSYVHCYEVNKRQVHTAFYNRPLSGQSSPCWSVVSTLCKAWQMYEHAQCPQSDKHVFLLQEPLNMARMVDCDNVAKILQEMELVLSVVPFREAVLFFISFALSLLWLFFEFIFCSFSLFTPFPLFFFQIVIMTYCYLTEKKKKQPVDVEFSKGARSAFTCGETWNIKNPYQVDFFLSFVLLLGVVSCLKLKVKSFFAYRNLHQLQQENALACRECLFTIHARNDIFKPSRAIADVFNFLISFLDFWRA